MIKPIIFNGEMVRAILSGRKTQTRRVVKPQPQDMTAMPLHYTDGIRFATERKYRKFPYGEPGDHLWVRETWMKYEDGQVIYKADCTFERNQWWQPDGADQPWPWRPSIHMPRNCSRILLEVVSTRVERLQDITREDALAEGVTGGFGPNYDFALSEFKFLWNSINGKRGFNWDTNPHLWVIEFKLAKQPF